MAFASSRSPTNTRADAPRFAAASASSSLWVRISDLDRRVQRARGLDHLRARSSVSGVAITSMRARRDVRLDQHRRLGRVAGHRGHASRAQLLDDLAVLLGDDERRCRAAVSAAAMRSPDPAVADQHHLVRQVLRVGGHRQLGQRVVARSQRRAPSAERARSQRRSGSIAANSSGLSAIEISAPARIRLCALRRQQAERHAQRRQDERELADLRQARRHRQRGVAADSANSSTSAAAASDLPTTMIATHRQHLQRLVDQHRADRTACRPRRRTAPRRRRAAAATPRRRGG